MRPYLLIAAGVLLFSCNENNKSTDTVQANVDSSVTKIDSSAYLNQDIAAAAVGTSDSMMPGTPTPESWKIAGFNDPAGFKTFFKEFRKWVAGNNIDSIAAHTRFPLRNCSSATEFKNKYSSLFNAEVRKAVANQDAEKFFANYNGVMAANGDLWFSEINNNYYIITINDKM